MTDVLIIGGGIIGLSIAWELSLVGAEVTIIERNTCGMGATWAAAGMLAPQAERLSGNLLDLALRSRGLYPNWISKLQGLTGMECGYWQCGILSPYMNEVLVWKHNLQNLPQYCDRQQVKAMQSGLSHNVVGGLWFDQDAQVDNRALAQVLLAALRQNSVKILEGVSVYSIATDHHHVTQLVTSQGNIQGDRYILATGAWTKELIPLPISPRKGQMLSVFDPNRSLKTVLFSDDVYIVPRLDGRIIIGASVEDVGFLAGNTAKGIATLLNNAIRLYPAIANMNIQSTWWGFRPHAPEEIPILEICPKYSNLILATGHYRNGILLAPVTASLIADLLK
ncbi:glycine oxidase [Synechococcus sp. PCC 7502]|uniref:glycine oxidase ThiO n=1 Tax=Synechococcus sp. PCC 7502 TaxID=1173263 RepID=UPI00029FC196|nr:glycine oxidase ThiO [Synechococcus sp. PCC 7502]AFY72206.1 glycine oxidase [Synechococcus sp. PCC 7502]